MADSSSSGLGNLLGEAFQRLGVGTTLSELRSELSSLGSEVAAAGLAAAQRAASEQHARENAGSESNAAPAHPEDDARPTPKASAAKRRPRRRTLRGGPRVAPDPEPAPERDTVDTVDTVEDAVVVALARAVQRLTERLERTCALVDTVADLVEEQSERLETVEGLLDQVVRNDHEPGPAASAPLPPLPHRQTVEGQDGIFLVDPDGVRGAVLGGTLRAQGVPVVVDDPELSPRPSTILGFTVAVHADADPARAEIACRASIAPQMEQAGPRRVVVYYMADEIEESTPERAAALASRIGACGVLACGSDGDVLLQQFSMAKP